MAKSLIVSHCLLLAWLITTIQACQTKPSSKVDSVRIHLYVASSMEQSVRCVNKKYLGLYPNRHISLSVLGSQNARLQISRGAPPGIFISAAKKHIDRLKTLKLIAQSKYLGNNEVVLLTRENSQVHRLEDLVNTTSLGIGAEAVPIGYYSWRILRAQAKQNPRFLSEVQKSIVTQDLSARSLKGRALRGELETVFLYRSDLQQVQTQYREVSLNKSLYHLSQVQVYIALTRKNTKDRVRKVDRQWYELMLGDSGQNCLRSHGILVNLEP